MSEIQKEYQEVVEYIESVRHILTNNGVSEADIDLVVNKPHKNVIEKFLDQCMKHGIEVENIAAGISNML